MVTERVTNIEIKLADPMKESANSLLKIGWREWAQLPELGIKALKFKTDTGARTSALHAMNIEYFNRNGKEWVRFTTQPHQKNRRAPITCEAPIFDTRTVTNSGGQRETRPVIETTLVVGEKTWQIRLTLTNRERMKFRMLLGRRAMTKHCWVDPTLSYVNGRPSKSS